MRRYSISNNRVTGAFLLLCLSALNAAAQINEQQITDGGSSRWWYTMIFVIAAGLGLAFYFYSKSRKGSDDPQYNYSNRYKDQYSTNESYMTDGLDADKEMEWLRKAKRSNGTADERRNSKTRKNGSAAQRATSSTSTPPAVPDLDFDTKIFQEKMRKLQYSQLPINSFDGLSPAKLYTPLPLSNDESLIIAIEQGNEEFEEDETVRDLAVRILTAFRTRNSVEALSQIALYDLSATLRSKAVSTLTDFDHESVFEALLLACADPTREVRAAAARGLFRLNFDRADAWKRIIETNDIFRMSHAARAAVESGIVQKSFDRLIHDDMKVAYEAFTLVTLLIMSGETSEIFEAVKKHKDERVRFALVHVLRVNRDERTLEQLRSLINDSDITTDVADRIRDAVANFETATQADPHRSLENSPSASRVG